MYLASCRADCQKSAEKVLFFPYYFVKGLKRNGEHGKMLVKEGLRIKATDRIPSMSSSGGGLQSLKALTAVVLKS